MSPGKRLADFFRDFYAHEGESMPPLPDEVRVPLPELPALSPIDESIAMIVHGWLSYVAISSAAGVAEGIQRYLITEKD